MKRFFIFFLVFIFSIAAVSAEDVNLTEDHQDLSTDIFSSCPDEDVSNETLLCASDSMDYVGGQVIDDQGVYDVNQALEDFKLMLSQTGPDISDVFLRNTANFFSSSLNRTDLGIPTVYALNMTKYYGDEGQFVVRFFDEDYYSLNTTQKASFSINGRLYQRVIDEKGYSRMNINLEPGNYTITTTNPVNGGKKTNRITVLSLIESNDLIKYYRNASQFTVRVLNRTGGNVTFNINGVFYTRQINESGYAKLNINLDPGEYIITTDYNGCRASNRVSVLSTLSSGDLSMSYMDGSRFTVTIFDGKGSPLANAGVNFNINGVFYTRTTDENGQARLNIRLMAGEYIITSTYNGLNKSNKITIGN